jgi:hypothetical protein
VYLVCKQFLNSLILWNSKFWQSAHSTLPWASSLDRMSRSACPTCIGSSLALVPILQYLPLPTAILSENVSVLIYSFRVHGAYYPARFKHPSVIAKINIVQFSQKVGDYVSPLEWKFTEFCESHKRKMIRSMWPEIKAYSRLITFTEISENCYPYYVFNKIQEKGNFLSTFCVVWSAITLSIIGLCLYCWTARLDMFEV